MRDPRDIVVTAARALLAEIDRRHRIWRNGKPGINQWTVPWREATELTRAIEALDKGNGNDQDPDQARQANPTSPAE